MMAGFTFRAVSRNTSGKHRKGKGATKPASAGLHIAKGAVVRTWQKVARLAGTMSTDEIADKLFISRNTVIMHARELQISLAYHRPRWTDADETELIKLRDEGLTHASIAGCMGRTKEAVYGRIKKLKKEGKI